MKNFKWGKMKIFIVVISVVIVACVCFVRFMDFEDQTKVRVYPPIKTPTKEELRLSQDDIFKTLVSRYPNQQIEMIGDNVVVCDHDGKEIIKATPSDEPPHQKTTQSVVVGSWHIQGEEARLIANLLGPVSFNKGFRDRSREERKKNDEELKLWSIEYEKKCKENGKRARKAGIECGANPYVKESERLAWYNGYLEEAENE